MLSTTSNPLAALSDAACFMPRADPILSTTHRSQSASLDLSSLSEIASSLPRQPVSTIGSDSQTTSEPFNTSTKSRRLSSASQARRRLSDATSATVTQALVSRVSVSPDRASASPTTAASAPTTTSVTTTTSLTPNSNVPSGLARSMPSNCTSSNPAPMPLPAPIVQKKKGQAKVFKCESCSKVYRHPSCLVKHRWEHSPHWREASKFSMSKHQQVQLLEAAAILSHIAPPSVAADTSSTSQQSDTGSTISADSLGLTEEEAQRMSSSLGTSLPEDRSLWPYFVSGGVLPPPNSALSVPYRSYENGYIGVGSNGGQSWNRRRRGSSVSAGSESVMVDVEDVEDEDGEVFDGEGESVVVIEEDEVEVVDIEGSSEGEVKEEDKDSGYGSGSGRSSVPEKPKVEERAGMVTRARSRSTSSPNSHAHPRSLSSLGAGVTGKSASSTRYSLRRAHGSSTSSGNSATKHTRTRSHPSGGHVGHVPTTSHSLPSSSLLSTSPHGGSSQSQSHSASGMGMHASFHSYNYSHPIAIPSIMPKPPHQPFAIISSSSTGASSVSPHPRVSLSATSGPSPISIPSSSVRGRGVDDVMEENEEEEGKDDDEETVDGDVDVEGGAMRWDEGMEMDMDV